MFWRVKPASKVCSLRPEDAGRDPNQRKALRRRVEEVQVDRRQERRPSPPRRVPWLSRTCSCSDLQPSLAGQRALERLVEGQGRAVPSADRRRLPWSRAAATGALPNATRQEPADQHDDQQHARDAHRGVQPRVGRLAPRLEPRRGSARAAGTRPARRPASARRRDQPADRGDRDRRAELAAFAAAERRRQHAEDHRQRRHQDRPQADRAGLEQRVLDRQPLAHVADSSSRPAGSRSSSPAPSA